jgi:DNA-binding response OmpR family regulator
MTREVTGRLNRTGGAVDNQSVRAPFEVVVADDDDVLRDLLVLNLEAEGLVVHGAGNGAEALQQIALHKPDLVVLDVMMPVHDGLGVLRAMRDEPSTARIPVVLLSARAADHEIVEGWEAGADYYLTKPFRVEQLLDFIDELAGSSR